MTPITLRVPGGKFSLGNLYMTREVMDRCQADEQFNVYVWESLKRHAEGDWGDVAPDSRVQNDKAVPTGQPLLSMYEDKTRQLPRIVIATSGNRFQTTVAFPVAESEEKSDY